MTEHRLEGATCSCGDWEPPLGASITRSFDQHLLAAHPALLADPAPEAARCGVGGPREAASDCIRWPDHDGEHKDSAGGRWPVAERPRYAAPADLPVATGVTTEDEGDLRLEFMSPAEIAAHDEHYPAPAPVASAGDEGEGLREEEREALETAARSTNLAVSDLQMLAVFVAVERILAARGAEAEQRGREDSADHGMCYVSGSKALAAREAAAARDALREAGDAYYADPHHGFVGPDDWMRDRADQIETDR